ncbi:MAG: NAD(P)H-dependent oxidoreductase subunit E [Verrucomicrobiia bacterium]
MSPFRPEFLAKVDETIAHYPVSKRSASLPLLHLWQEEFGHISDEAIHWIAEKLSLQPIQILELVTFYPMFRQKPFGKYHIKVCRTLSCALGGGYELHECFKKTLQVDGDAHGPIHSPDGKYTLEFVECLASCGTAPVCMINDDFHEKVDSQEKVNALLAKCN